MSSLQTLNNSESGLIARWKINDNFTALNTDKAEKSGWTFTGDISVPDEAYGADWNGSLEVPTKNSVYDKIETMWGGGSTTFIWLTDTPSSYSGQTGKFPKVNAGETALEFVTLTGGWDALVSNPLSQFASTTSSQLDWVISDNTGSGWLLVFSNSPSLTTPSIAAINVSGWVLTLPTGASDTLVGKITTDTFSTGVKTFLNWILGLRNVANTFTSFFTNTNTASRTYTLKDANGTIAFTSDITGTNSGTNTGDETTGRINTLYGTTNAITVGSVEVWNATDTTISRVSAWVIAVEGVTVPTISSTNTLTNKRVTKRILSVTQSATPAINTDNGDIMQITGLAQAITSMTTSLTGTPSAGDMMMIQITDNGTARAITWWASFASTTVTLPTTTVVSTMLRVLFQRNNANTVWECIATC